MYTWADVLFDGISVMIPWNGWKSNENKAHIVAVATATTTSSATTTTTPCVRNIQNTAQAPCIHNAKSIEVTTKMRAVSSTCTAKKKKINMETRTVCMICRRQRKNEGNTRKRAVSWQSVIVFLWKFIFSVGGIENRWSHANRCGECERNTNEHWNLYSHGHMPNTGTRAAHIAIPNLPSSKWLSVSCWLFLFRIYLFIHNIDCVRIL